jgi:hypothetical protein
MKTIWFPEYLKGNHTPPSPNQLCKLYVPVDVISLLHVLHDETDDLS